MIININNPASVDMNNTAAVEAIKTMTDHFGQIKDVYSGLAPVVNVTNQVNPTPVNITNEVNPTPVNIENIVVPAPVVNEVTVKPADVVLDKGKRKAKITRDGQGKITEIVSDEAK